MDLAETTRSPLSGPFFTIAITAYNRETEIERCLESCFRQDFSDFEVVVVDDGSTDGTAAVLQERWEPRIRLFRHPTNQGTNPSRHTAVSQARGEWVVVLDSDDELVPHSLRRLHEIIDELPPDVRVVRGRYLWNDGQVTPRFVPDGPIGYVGRIQWVEQEGGHDDLHCVHRSVFARTPYIRGRRGPIETLWELDLARNELVLYVEEVLALAHNTAVNSILRSVDRRELVPRLLAEAEDVLWVMETTLRRHGDALRKHGPGQYREILRIAAEQAFLVNERRKALRYVRDCARCARPNFMLGATLALGLAGPKALAHGAWAGRRLGIA